MARKKIKKYGLAWNEQINAGRISIVLTGDVKKNIEISNASEFVAISSVLGRGDAYYVDDHIIATGWMPA